MIPQTTRSLRVCIDDLGLHAGVNEGAVRLWTEGRVSSWSVLVDGPAASGLAAWWRDAALNGAKRRPELGLHLNLTEAVSAEGRVRPLSRWILASACGSLRTAAAQADLREEIGRQWQRFVALFGRTPDFVDGHQHVHQLPGVREALLAVLAEALPADARTRPWLRHCGRPEGAAATEPPGERFKPWLIERLGSRGLQQMAQAAGWPQTRALLGVRRLVPGEAAFARRLARWLNEASDGALLMVHPACAHPGVSDPLMAARQTEFTVLSGPDWPRLLGESGWRVGTVPA